MKVDLFKVYLIAGLGNPGLKYRQTRHNIGIKVVTRWGRGLGLKFGSRRFHSRNTKTAYRGKEIILLRPVTFMNLSGKSIKACADFYQLEAGNILVVHDDLDLPLGRIKVVKKGGAGGHRGVASIIEYLGTSGFPRVKIGIGRPRCEESIEEYVLSPFYGDEKDWIDHVTRWGVRACELFVEEGVEMAMNRINCQNIISGKEVIY